MCVRVCVYIDIDKYVHLSLQKSLEFSFYFMIIYILKL